MKPWILEFHFWPPSTPALFQYLDDIPDFCSLPNFFWKRGPDNGSWVWPSRLGDWVSTSSIWPFRALNKKREPHHGYLNPAERADIWRQIQQSLGPPPTALWSWRSNTISVNAYNHFYVIRPRYRSRWKFRRKWNRGATFLSQKTSPKEGTSLPFLS